MSKPIRYDSLLVRDLATELNGALAGQPLYGVRLERGSRLLELETTEASWRWALHPQNGEVFRAARAHIDANVVLPRRARIECVVSVPDERILEIHIRGEGDSTHGGTAERIIIELLTNQWNALALAAGNRIIHVLRPRSAGSRTLMTGDTYTAPAGTDRIGAERLLTAEEWDEVLGAAEPGQRVRTYVGRIAWASPINAPYVIGAADVHDAALPDAYLRYVSLVDGPRSPCILPPPYEGQPYGVQLDPGARAFPSLLEAIAASVETPAAGAAEEQREAALANAAVQAERAAARARRLAAELESVPAEAASLRHTADLLLAQVHRVPKGATRVELDDFQGGVLDVELDGTLTPAENAAQYYARARKRERAAARLPDLITRARDEAAHWSALRQRIESGAATAEEIAAAQPAPLQGPRAKQQVALPYRVYRTSGGLEVRVGRNPRANDALTLRHSSGNDIWLHARDVGGAHVILRWNDREANPPHRDIEEAAVLAALHSKARTSKLVPVDYTRRKYVRKPRKSPPGKVVFERGRTIFVEPDPDVAEALRQG